MTLPEGIETAEVVLPCADLNATLAFFTDRLGMRVLTLRPAEAPTQAVVAGHGLRVCLVLGDGDPGRLRLRCADVAGQELVAPNGTVVELVPARPPLVLPPLRPAFVHSRLAEAEWTVGRAGMRYRDLIPGRLGGRFVASHIRIPDGGPVPDYVHFHQVRFQLIVCARGWVRVVYEDQGPPFVLQPGDCVLQPPGIRHRVLESSPGLEVVEVTCPADHATWADPELELPTPALRPERRFEGQRFVRHRAEAAPWSPWTLPGFQAQDMGLGDATGDLARAELVRACPPSPPARVLHAGELWFAFVLEGSVTLARDGHPRLALAPGDALVLPPEVPCELSEPTPDLWLLHVALPARPSTGADPVRFVA